eukprot:jgi/Bigna1/137948/aug1.42_g12656
MSKARRKEERRLEELLFATTNFDEHGSSEKGKNEAKAASGGGAGDDPFALEGPEEGKTLQAAWVDEHDETIEVNVAAKGRLRKLRKDEDETMLSGDVYVQRLRDQFSAYPSLH